MAPITKAKNTPNSRVSWSALQRGHGQHVNDQGGDAAKDLDDESQLRDDGLLEFIGQLLDWSARSPIVVLTLARPNSVPVIRAASRAAFGDPEAI